MSSTLRTTTTTTTAKATVPWWKSQWFTWLWIILVIALVIFFLVWLFTMPGTISEIVFQPNTNEPGGLEPLTLLNGSLQVNWQWKPSWLTSNTSPTFRVDVWTLVNCSATPANFWKSFTTTRRSITLGIIKNPQTQAISLDYSFPLFQGNGVYVRVQVDNWLHPFGSSVEAPYYPVCIVPGSNSGPQAPTNIASICSAHNNATPLIASTLNASGFQYCGTGVPCGSTGATGATGIVGPPSYLWASSPVTSGSGSTVAYSTLPWVQNSANVGTSSPVWTFNDSLTSCTGAQCPLVACTPSLGGATGDTHRWISTANQSALSNATMFTQTYNPANPAFIPQAQQTCLSTPGCVGFSANPTNRTLQFMCSRAATQPTALATTYILLDNASKQFPDSC